MPSPSPARRHKEHAELLFKGVTCTIIGIVILLAPYYAKSLSVRDLMGQVYLVGWFALVLGVAFIGRWGWLRARASGQPRP